MIPFPNKKYSIIYADPPWQFSNYSDEWHKQGEKSGWVGKKYSLMSQDEIKALPIKDITEKDCVLFLWATYPKLKDAIKTIDAWGFKYKTVAFTWIKQNKKSSSYFTGMGFWTRANAEICLLAVRGNPRRVRKNVRQLIVSPRREHSQKPDQARERILDLMGDISRIELFARDKIDGWDVWGEEVVNESITI